MSSTIEEIRRFWDDDAPTYDDAASHAPQSPAVRAAWAAALARLLPPAPARVLDVGSGTGFLALAAARLGHQVTALDLSEAMLARLRDKAAAAGLAVEVVVGSAESPPAGPFDVVIERHVCWTLPDPALAVKSWRQVCPDGRLILFESVWGGSAPAPERALQLVRDQVARLRQVPPPHHGDYDDALRESLPLGNGTPPSALVELVEAAGWPVARLERLRDVEWASSIELPAVARLAGVASRFAIVAGDVTRPPSPSPASKAPARRRPRPVAVTPPVAARSPRRRLPKES